MRVSVKALRDIRERLEIAACDYVFAGPVPDALANRIRRVHDWMGEDAWRLTTMMYMDSTATLSRRQSVFGRQK